PASFISQPILEGSAPVAHGPVTGRTGAPRASDTSLPPRGAAMTPGAEAGAAPPKPLFGGCWSCRVLSGVGLLLAGLWIYQGPRQSMKRGIPPSMGAIAQITFALSECHSRGPGPGGASPWRRGSGTREHRQGNGTGEGALPWQWGRRGESP
uniref:Distal membrane-arm assembly complex protein 1-like domain-containing protein n=1 Tax=Apteryx owenii TaxID=8824 RepID=A0A8B9PIS7_APTOW